MYTNDNTLLETGARHVLTYIHIQEFEISLLNIIAKYDSILLSTKS